MTAPGRPLVPPGHPTHHGRSAALARRAALLAALLAALVAVVPVLGAAPAGATTGVRASRATEPITEPLTQEPLRVELTSVSPAVMPTSGAVTLTGRVTNTTDQTWRTVNVATTLSGIPMTTEAEVTEAVRSDPLTTPVGNRLQERPAYAALGDLGPGQTRDFELRVPQRFLPSSQPGVYWLGVQALGSEGSIRDALADGRARTLLPARPQGRLDASLVLPLRGSVRRTPQGAVAHPRALAADMTTSHGRMPAGRLARLLDLGGQPSPTRIPFTLLLDPAVLDAAGDLAGGNDPADLSRLPGAAPTPTQTPSRSPSRSPSKTPGASATRRPAHGPSGSPTASPSRSSAPGSTPSPGRTAGPPAPKRTGAGPLTRAQRAAARDWLRRASALSRRHPTLSLPYADPDVSALARLDRTLLRVAQEQSTLSLRARGLDALHPAVAPPEGRMSPRVVRQVAPTTTALLSDLSVPGERTWFASRFGPTIGVDTAPATEGGPGPGRQDSALQMRQRILSSAALAAEDGVRRPLLVVLPSLWDPGPGTAQADFLGGLVQPWLHWRGLGGDGPLRRGRVPSYPSSQRSQEMGRKSVRAARALTGQAGVFTDLLDAGQTVTRVYDGTALDAVSYAARTDRRRRRAVARASTRLLHRELGQVRVTGTDFVTLSSTAGSITVSVTNDLPQPVTVGLRVNTGGRGVRIEPHDPIRMAAMSRTTLRLPVSATKVGVHDVTLTPVTSNGRTFGVPLRLRLRTSQVGRVLWAVMGLGLLILVVMILRRSVQRLRERRARREAEDAARRRAAEPRDAGRPGPSGGPPLPPLPREAPESQEEQVPQTSQEPRARGEADR